VGTYISPISFICTWSAASFYVILGLMLTRVKYRAN